MPTAAAQPFQAFAYLDIEHPVVAWGAYRGVLVSARAEGQTPEGPVSLMFAGIIEHQNNARLHNELVIERVRAQKFPEQTSRLSGMYFFTDVAQAHAALSWGSHFCRENLVEVEVYPVRQCSKVDASWITHAQIDETGRIDARATTWIEQYWAGEPLSDSPVWEIIVDGRAVISGTGLRQRAYDLTARIFPNALDTLEVARLAATVGSDLGQTTAWITRAASDRLRLAYYLDMRDAENPEFLDRLGKYDGPKNMKDLALGKEMFGLPDFRQFGCDFTVSQVKAAFSRELRVHRNEVDPPGR
jgi:hypothetical protein